MTKEWGAKLKGCKYCGAALIFPLTVNGKQMPCDPTPDPTGNVAVYTDETGTEVALVVTKTNPAPRGSVLHMPHFATCTNLPKREGRPPTTRRRRHRPMGTPLPLEIP